MTVRLYNYGDLLKPGPTRAGGQPGRDRNVPRDRRSKIARELAGGDLIDADGRIALDAWPPAFVIDGWPPPMDGLDGWPPRTMDEHWPPVEAGWPGGSAWAVEASPFPREREADPFARPRDIDPHSSVDPHSAKGRWLAGMDRNFGPGWEDWDGVVTVDLCRR